jgi:RNA polymerase sigma factor (sigma-70 family)
VDRPVDAGRATLPEVGRPVGVNDSDHDAVTATLPVGRADPRPRDETERVRRTTLDLYDRYHRDLATFVRAIERDPEAAEDIVADTFVRLIDELRKGRTVDQPRAWLHRVAANLVIDGGRRRSVATRFLGRLVDHRTAPAPDETILRGETRREVGDALAELPVDDRTALMLAAHGFSGREIAAALGRSELATRSLICRARIRLRERLESEARP